jgi:hypothetical protein
MTNTVFCFDDQLCTFGKFSSPSEVARSWPTGPNYNGRPAARAGEFSKLQDAILLCREPRALAWFAKQDIADGWYRVGVEEWAFGVEYTIEPVYIPPPEWAI